MGRRITVLVGLVSTVGLVLMQSPASADHGDVSLLFDTVVRVGEGEVVQLASVPVDPELVGVTCSWEFHATNQKSVHLGNDLILSTGGTDTVVPGVEDAPDQVLDVAGSFQLGETVTVSLRMGPDQVFSAGLSVEVVCEADVAPASTTSSTTSTTTSTTTTAPAPTTSTPAPTTTAAPAVETEVAGEVVAAEPPAPAAPALAVTGPSTSAGPMVGLAVVLLLGGIGLFGLGTHARD